MTAPKVFGPGTITVVLSEDGTMIYAGHVELRSVVMASSVHQHGGSPTVELVLGSEDQNATEEEERALSLLHRFVRVKRQPT